MALRGNKSVHAHLRVAYIPRGEATAPSRAWLVVRAMLVRFRIFLLNVVAVAGAMAALAPLLVRRTPLQHRTHLPRRTGRVIPLEPRRRATPS